jgi:hypothetical protein
MRKYISIVCQSTSSLSGHREKFDLLESKKITFSDPSEIALFSMKYKNIPLYKKLNAMQKMKKMEY